MPVITATAYLFWKGAEINWLFALWALLNIVIFHAAGNTWSDYFDFRKKVDADDTFGAKTLTTGMFTEKEIFRLSLGLTIIAAAGGVGLLLMTGLPLLWIGLAGVACTLLYPVLKYNALGDFDIVMAFAIKNVLHLSRMMQKGSGNEVFPEWNPQTEFISVEENSESPKARVCSYACF